MASALKDVYFHFEDNEDDMKVIVYNLEGFGGFSVQNRDRLKSEFFRFLNVQKNKDEVKVRIFCHL